MHLTGMDLEKALMGFSANNRIVIGVGLACLHPQTITASATLEVNISQL